MSLELNGLVPGGEVPGRLESVINVVNNAFPDYGGPVISPFEMAETGRAACFGRLATIGGGLTEEGLDECNIQWLISLSHGQRFSSGSRELDWFGHVQLVVEDEEAFIVDALFYAFVADEPKRMSLETKDYMQLDGLRILEKLPAIRASSYYFSVYPFAEGIDSYQAMHRWYQRKPEVWHAEDYASLYRSLEL